VTGAGVLVPLPVVLPLLGAATCLLLGGRPRPQRTVSVSVLSVALLDAVALLVLVDRDGPAAVQVGGWPVPLGITLVADRFATLPLAASALVLLAVLGYSIGQRMRRRTGTEPGLFHPAYLTLAAGVNLAFLSGDLFNLFVGFELMLASSYVLITLAPNRTRVRAGMTYIVVSLTASVLFLTAVAACYAATGTVNLAQLAQRIPELPAGTRSMLGLLLLVVFGVKAAVVPLHLWLPDSYPAALTNVTAVFAALLTKVAVYALVRTQTMLFPRTEVSRVLLVLALATLLVGIAGALVQDDLNRLLSFTLVGHIGFMLFGLALWSVAGLRGTALYLVHHILVQAALFMAVGVVEADTGTGSLRALAGRRADRADRPPAGERRLAGAVPAVAPLFLLAGLSLSGIPPFSGFVAKLALFQAGVGAGNAGGYVLTAGAVATSLLTLVVVSRVWVQGFWGPAAGRPDRSAGPQRPAPAGGHRVMVGTTGALVVAGLAVAALAGPLAAVATRAADDLLSRSPYEGSVLIGGLP
jgi:multicomponent Na+:H+ antiporter subunit D